MKTKPNRTRTADGILVFLAALAVVLMWAFAARSDSKAPTLRESLIGMLPTMTRLPTLPNSHPFMVRANAAVLDLESAIAAEDIPAGDRVVWAKRAWVWSYHESAFQTDALGDGGASCGVLQIQTPERWLKDATCDAVRKDRVMGFRVGMRLMKHLIEKCGSVRSGLTSYATGKDCPTYTIGLVNYRMKLAGET